MQRIEITHTTSYQYPQAVEFLEHKLHVRPREGHDIRIEASSLSISPAYTIRWQRDVYGNSVAIVTFTQAALGARIEIPTLEREEVVKVPAGTQPGEIVRLKGRGVRDISGRRRGDLFVKVLVRTPDDLSKEQKALLTKLAEIRGENIESVDKSVIHRLKNILQ